MFFITRIYRSLFGEFRGYVIFGRSCESRWQGSFLLKYFPTIFGTIITKPVTKTTGNSPHRICQRQAKALRLLIHAGTRCE